MFFPLITGLITVIMTAHKTLFLALILLAGAASFPLLAQETEQDADASDSTAATAENPQEPQQGADEELILAEDETPENTEAAEPPVASNEDFNPSVQISEDLSVSFPVDI